MKDIAGWLLENSTKKECWGTLQNSEGSFSEKFKMEAKVNGASLELKGTISHSIPAAWLFVYDAREGGKMVGYGYVGNTKAGDETVISFDC